MKNVQILKAMNQEVRNVLAAGVCSVCGEQKAVKYARVTVGTIYNACVCAECEAGYKGIVALAKQEIKPNNKEMGNMTNNNKAVSTVKPERKPNSCIDCGKKVSVRVAQISKSKFGKVLCYSSQGACCQHNHQPVVKQSAAKKEIAATTPKSEKPKMTVEQFIEKLMAAPDATKVTLTVGQLKKIISASEASASVNNEHSEVSKDENQDCTVSDVKSTEESLHQEDAQVSQSAEQSDVSTGHSAEVEAGSVVYTHVAPDLFGAKKLAKGTEYVSPIYCTEGIGCKGCKGTNDAEIARAYNENVSVQRDLAEAEAVVSEEAAEIGSESLLQNVTETVKTVVEETMEIVKEMPKLPSLKEELALPEADEDMFAENKSNGSVTESYE